MKKQHRIGMLIITLLLIAGVMALSGCTPAASAGPKSELEARVSTAAAATLVQYMVETEVAAQSAALAQAPAAQAEAPLAQATQPPTPTTAPTFTPVPTQPAAPTTAPTAVPPSPTAAAAAASSAAGPTINADQNTNCRAGPGTHYRVVSYFMKGDQSTVEGQDSGKDWWYIVDPEDAGGFCWVWDGSTTVVGDASTVPVVAAPAAPKQSYSKWYCGDHCYYPHGWCGYGFYDCGDYPWYSDSCWKTSNWWGCNPCANWPCPPGWKNIWPPPWEKSNCPPVTQVNYKKYCKNYPWCCDD